MLFYLLQSDDLQEVTICRDDEIDTYLDSGLTIISQGFDTDKLISQGFSEARKINYKFVGYKEPQKHQRKEVIKKQGLQSPIKFK